MAITKHSLLLGISLAALTLSCLPALAQSVEEADTDEVVLPTIDVNALAEASPYSMTSPASTTNAGIVQLTSGGGAKKALRSMAGIFTMSPSDQPALQANIRGLEGFGRVNNMIDGVPQTFRNIAGHGAGNAGLTYIDPTLLAGIEPARDKRASRVLDTNRCVAVDFISHRLPRDVMVVEEGPAGLPCRGSGVIFHGMRALTHSRCGRSLSCTRPGADQSWRDRTSVV